MTQPAKAQEPTMEEILASIRRIIADDDAVKTPEPPPAPAQPAVKTAPPPPPPPDPMPPPVAANNQDDIDAVLAGFDATAKDVEFAEPDLLELTPAMRAK